MSDLKDTAFELFSEVHSNLGHDNFATSSVDYFEHPKVLATWIEIARLAEAGIDVCDRCDKHFLAYKLFASVHTALNDIADTSLASFALFTPRANAWVEIAKVLTERQKQAKKMADHPSLNDT